jgi:hypothetical protein
MRACMRGVEGSVDQLSCRACQKSTYAMRFLSTYQDSI